jgi:putative transposase
VVRFLVWVISAALKPKALLVAENLCLRQQLLALHRRHPQSRLRNADRLDLRQSMVRGRRNSFLIVKPETVLRWHRRGWRAYWSWGSNRQHRKIGRRPIPQHLQTLIRQMTAENRLWGQKRIQAELARLGFEVSARTVAKYMSRRLNGAPSSGWREFLRRHESNIWACDFFGVRTILFQTLYVFFVVRHVNREILHIAVTLRLGSMATTFSDSRSRQPIWRDVRRRLRHLGIEQVRTPFRAPRANAISERWVKSVRTAYLDHLFIFSESHLRRAVSSHVAYFNGWRPHRSLGQRAPRDSTIFQIRACEASRKIIAEPVLGGLHHVYKLAA